MNRIKENDSLWSFKRKRTGCKRKKYSVVMQYLKTAFKFFKAYIMRLGVLDGKEEAISCPTCNL
jgi:hypothetical protein